jgi:glucose uptake protein GlcU
LALLTAWVWLLGLVAQIVSLSTGRLVPSAAAVSVANPIVSVLLGALVLQERLEKSPPWHAVVAVGALCLALLGSVLISSARERPHEAEEPEPVTAAPQFAN